MIKLSAENYSAYQKKYSELLPETYEAYRCLKVEDRIEVNVELAMRLKYPTGPLPPRLGKQSTPFISRVSSELKYSHGTVFHQGAARPKRSGRNGKKPLFSCVKG